jgi:phosphatidylserine/phosphatidylglycerophosphate/cardiolipin synthase-like enzyme
MSLLNFKANHRKLIICDTPDGYSALVTSANPHDGSSAHGNVAIYFHGQAVLDLLKTENAVLGFSGGPIITLPPGKNENIADTETTIQILSERKIKDVLIERVNMTGAEDKLTMVTFYLSDRDVIRSLKRACVRGAEVRVLLDPNKDAFGRGKNGIPNRPVANELVKAGIAVRWSDTHGEQAHTKMLLVEYQHGQNMIILGSANFTRRNLNDLNLETDIAVLGNAESPFFVDVKNYTELLWNNREGKSFSVDYNKYADNSLFNFMLYRWMEGTGMSSF